MKPKACMRNANILAISFKWASGIRAECFVVRLPSRITFDLAASSLSRTWDDLQGRWIKELRSRSLYAHHRTRRFTDDCVRVVTKAPLITAATVTADHEEIGMKLLGSAGDRFVRFSCFYKHRRVCSRFGQKRDDPTSRVRHQLGRFHQGYGVSNSQLGLVLMCKRESPFQNKPATFFSEFHRTEHPSAADAIKGWRLFGMNAGPDETAHIMQDFGSNRAKQGWPIKAKPVARHHHKIGSPGFFQFGTSAYSYLLTP